MIEIAYRVVGKDKRVVVKKSLVTSTYYVGIEDHLIFTGIQSTMLEEDAIKIMKVMVRNMLAENEKG